jgi:septal ring factor EnvC (AmiA/AmiB activator)
MVVAFFYEGETSFNFGGKIKMPIEITQLVSVLSFLVAAFALARNLKLDTKSDQTELTTVIVKLENINDNIKEVKVDMKDIISDMDKVKERLTAVEASAKSAHKRIDNLHNEHQTEE